MSSTAELAARYGMSEDMYEEVRDTFKVFDKDNDGQISVSELEKVFESLDIQLSAEELSELLKAVDKDGNGSIDLDEFCVMMASKGLDPDEELRLMFSTFDTDGNGTIDKEELYAAMKAMGETLTQDELDEMMAEADENGDGQVDFEEFKRMINKA